MAKIDKQSATEQIREADRYTGFVKYHVRQLPRTPGSERTEQALEQVRKGLDEIKREAEID